MSRVKKGIDLDGLTIQDLPDDEEVVVEETSSHIFDTGQDIRFSDSSKSRIIDNGIATIIDDVSITEIIQEFTLRFVDLGGQCMSNAFNKHLADLYPKDWEIFNQVFGEMLKKGYSPSDLFLGIQLNISVVGEMVNDSDTKDDVNLRNMIQIALNVENLSILTDYLAYKYHVKREQPTSKALSRFS